GHDGRDGDEGLRAEGAEAEGRPGAGRVCRVRRGRVHAVREVRGEAGTLPRQPAAGGGRAREGLADGPLPATPRCAAHGRGCAPPVHHQRGRQRDRAGRRGCGDRQWRGVRAGLSACAQAARDAFGPGHRPHVARDRRRHLHLYEQEYPGPRAGSRGGRSEGIVKDVDVADAQTSNGAAPGDSAWLDELTPQQIVAELDKYIVGQDAAKRAVAIALRNRWRRQRVDDELRDEIVPNNIILIGPTGVGKTEIARRLARLAGAPFVKVEASKCTEVGYVGRDVESMIRDLVDMAVNMVRDEREAEVEEVAQERVEERLLDLLLPQPDDDRFDDGGEPPQRPRAFIVGTDAQAREEEMTDEDERRRIRERRERTREKLRTLLRDGKLEERMVDIEVQQNLPIENMMLPMGAEGMDNITEMLQEMMPKRKKRRTVSIAEAR